MRRQRQILALAWLLVTASLGAQEPVDLEVVTAIRAEGFDRSQVMDTLWHLTDRLGPRLTNSPAERKASAWARDRLTAFGLENAALEPFGEFGLGWSTERCVVEMTAPGYMPVIAVPKAWTLGLDDPVEGAPVLVSVSTLEEARAFAGQLAGKIVLSGSVRPVPSPFEAAATRHDEESLDELAMAPTPGSPDGSAARRRNRRASRRLATRLAGFYAEEGALVVLEPDSGRRGDYGVVSVGSGGPRDPELARGMPQLVVAAEHWNRLARLVERGEDVRVRVDVQTTFHDEDLVGRNVVAEIPGTDPEIGDEVVMLGAHFDSWHPATGATDNGAACAVVMEAVRILKAIGVQPRRTIRAVLWNGEEQGLHGSKGYVKAHFGDPETMELLPEHDELAAYFNLDNGAGRIRGVYMEGNAALQPIFSAWLAPFADLDAKTLTLRETGGTDHLSFQAVGLPGFQFIQDPMDYGARTHHSSMDFFERVHAGDVMQSSVILASFVYHAAMRDEKLPRKPLPVIEAEEADA